MAEISSPSQTLVRAIKAYKPKRADGLAFKKGQVVALKERDEEQRLFHGEFTSRNQVFSGWFPYDAVKVLSPAETKEILQGYNATQLQHSEHSASTKGALESALRLRSQPQDLVERGILSEDQVEDFGRVPTDSIGGGSMRKRGISHRLSSRILGGKKESSKNLLATAAASHTASIFGGTLGQCMFTSYTEFRIPPMIECIVVYLKEHALQEQGLFRLSGSTGEVNELKEFWEQNHDDEVATRGLDLSKYQVHSLSSVLKLYLRELSDPLLTFDLYDNWVAAMQIEDESERIASLVTTVKALPDINLALLRYLFEFLVLLATFSEENKMTAENLGIVFGPTLLKKREADAMSDMLGNQDLVDLVKFMIEHDETIQETAFPPQRKTKKGGSSQRRKKERQKEKQQKADVAIQVIQGVDLDGEKLPEGWEMAVDGKGRAFFIDHVNEKTSWKDPRTGKKYRPKAGKS
jgi:RhoGAP domain/WW domain/Variant SH3 domain